MRLASDRVFQVALIISVLVHGAILLQHSNFSIFSQNIKTQELKVEYIKPAQANKEELKNTPLRKEPFLKLPPKIRADNRIPPPFIDKENIFKTTKPLADKEMPFAKPAFVKPDILAIKKKITLPPIELDKINNPTYISYYQIVREKIKRAAYQNYTGSETGEVTVAFIISNEGYLKDLHLVEGKSSQSQYLRGVALESIKGASPFPSFPKELDYPQLSFNLAITFEIE